MDSDVDVVGELEAYHVWFSSLDAALCLFHAKAETVLHRETGVAVILEGFLLSLKLFAFGIKSLWLVEGVVSPALADELFGILAVHGFAVALAVRAVGTSDMDTFVELDAEPCEGLDDVVFGAWHEAGLVGILDAENHLAAILFGEQVVIQCGAHTADVKRSGGAWCKTYSYFL